MLWFDSHLHAIWTSNVNGHGKKYSTAEFTFYIPFVQSVEFGVDEKCDADVTELDSGGWWSANCTSLHVLIWS
jgi:hypothetical protein